MSTQLVAFSRQFQVWLYTVGHAQLLLRSTKTQEHPTRIDVLFKVVGAIYLPTLFDGLTILEASQEEISNLNLAPPFARGSKKMYLMQGANFSGYVMAGIVTWHEDDGEYNDPSYFQIFPPNRR